MDKRKNPISLKVENRKKLEIEERRAIVAANILAGASYRHIAKTLGVSPATIAKDFKAIIKGWQEESRDIIGDWVPVEVHRLDVMVNAIWDDVRGGDLKAMDRMLRVMERRARLLGLDAPTPIALQNPDGSALIINIVKMDIDEI